MILLALGAMLVGGLIVWALTRTVDTSSPAPSVAEGFPTSSVATAPANTPVIGDTASTSFTPSTATAPPMASTTAPITVNSTPPPPSQADRSEVARISVEDLREKVKAGNVTIIDVRDASSYQTAHIPGSMNIPFASIAGSIDLIPKGKDIVLYCT